MESADKGTGQVEPRFSGRVGAAFQLLMRMRMLIAAVTLLLIPPDELSPVSFLLVLSIVLVSWLAARQWQLIAPSMAAHPLLLALDICLSFVVLGIGGTSGPFFMSTVVTAAVAGLLYRWPGMLAAVGLQVLCYYATYGITVPESAPVDFQTLLGQPLFYPVTGFAGVGLRRLLDDYSAQEKALRLAEVNAAAALERSRLAREMHDSLAKTLRGVALAAAALPTWVRKDAKRASAEAQRIAAACEIASREARSLLGQLRDDSAIRPLPEAVRCLADRWSADIGTPVTCEADDRLDLSLRVRHEAIAILSEVLTNVERHARAKSVDVWLTAEGDGVVLTVRDDGRGFQLPELPELARAGHYGLVGLHERAERVGGSVRVLSALGSGTTVTVRLPVEEPADLLAEVSE